MHLEGWNPYLSFKVVFKNIQNEIFQMILWTSSNILEKTSHLYSNKLINYQVIQEN